MSGKKGQAPLTIEQLKADSRHFYDALSAEPVLPKILLGQALIERHLHAMLMGFVVDPSSNTALTLFHHTGRLGDVFAKAQLAYCLGLIPQFLFDNVCALGEIRNAFGHSHKALSIDDEQISDLLKKITWENFHMETEGRYLTGYYGTYDIGKTNLDRLTYAIYYCVSLLSWINEYAIQRLKPATDVKRRPPGESMQLVLEIPNVAPNVPE
ncbi:MAG: hypothetical protein ACJ8C4_17595 [Gemmataceae bacterium]